MANIFLAVPDAITVTFFVLGLILAAIGIAFGVVLLKGSKEVRKRLEIIFCVKWYMILKLR